MYLPGVGPRRAAALATVGIETVRDLLHWYPRRYLDRATIVPVGRLAEHGGETVTTIGTVAAVKHVVAKRRRVVVTLRDGFQTADLVFFQGLNYWKDAFETGETIAASGAVSLFGRAASFVHPDIDRLVDGDTLDFINTGGIIPVYRSGAELEKVGLNRQGGFRRLLRAAIDAHLGDVSEHFDDAFRAAHHLAPLQSALRTIHFPESAAALVPARRRLVFDEFFLLSLMMALQKHGNSVLEPGIAFRSESPRARALVAALPFRLTRAQLRVLREIVDDMARPHPMNRLLHGDVGSGKTVVALLAALVAIDNGYQVALMAPTEILAAQHYRTITALLADQPVEVRLLTGRQRQSGRARILDDVAAGRANIVIGTHALIQGGVQFDRLGLVIIDEQHRFGVRQRGELRDKGVTPDVLVMTATPIPRTLSMTTYGDLDVSALDELPPGRKDVRTAIRFDRDRPAVNDFLRAEIAAGAQAYIVLPLIEESEKLDLKAATAHYELLSREVFPDFRIGLLHGRMAEAEKDGVMGAFLRREVDIIVATTVIEVGVDVPNASVMVVEHAERFGLAQLHQLRGRVGRGTRQSYCILMTSEQAYYARTAAAGDAGGEASNARVRLDTLRDSNDGFRIAEVDLALRGPGEIWGTMQSGYPELKIADLVVDVDILAEARDAAFGIVAADPELRLPEHHRLATALDSTLRERHRNAGTA